ncbi:MAG: hypothetical protein JKX78_07020 [Alteromonadaceae bacterium]|nr:hypothetical protein [Alteromonadaceae bacterium]
MKKLSILFITLFMVSNVFSEDIDLYLGDLSQRTGNRPQVLIIFDTSGSMGWNQNIKTPYDPSNLNTCCQIVAPKNNYDDKSIYYIKGSGVDLNQFQPTDNRHFLATLNNCKSAQTQLDTIGFYTGHIREYKFQGNSGSWQELNNSDGSDIRIVDCGDDVANSININNGLIRADDGSTSALSAGYPADGLGNQTTPTPYTSTIGNSNVTWSGEVVTLYSGNYLRWRNNDNLPLVTRTRLEIAQSTITNLINSVPSVDFGLEVYNRNYGTYNGYTSEGGRIALDIQKDASTDMKIIVNDKIFAQGGTPLCESLYEAMLYFGGKNVLYGYPQVPYYNGAFHPGEERLPPIDQTAQSNGKYISPFVPNDPNVPVKNCEQQVFVIYMTDGAPTSDNKVDNLITALPGGVEPPFTWTTYNNEGKATTHKNYLTSLAKWMNINDLNNDVKEKQSMVMYTIGFGDSFTNINDPNVTTETKLLDKAATNAKGKYYPASDPSSLLSSLQSIISNISKISSTFTGASVATNSFDRTETLDAVYYAMFLPDRGPRWQGNIKKLKIVVDKQVDRTGVEAIDSAGTIKSSAKTFWSSNATADGNKVGEGGVAEMLRNKTNRVIYSDVGTSAGLKVIPLCDNSTSIGCDIESSFGGSASMAVAMGINEVEIKDTLNWARGIDVDDADSDGLITDNRLDVFGDPLHSKPLVVNYGGTETNQDVRIIVGTNAGVLHMFQDKGDTEVDETWAFMPKELFKNIHVLRSNFASASKVYGVDGAPALYKLDVNGDGVINSADGDKAWVFFGLRRGGNSYYGLDISNPNAPKLMWHIDNTTTGYSELGQSWSKPRIAYSKLNMGSSGAKPVLIFGGGYAISKDASGIGGNDNVGRAIFMADAATGKLVWSLSPGATTATNTKFEGTDSIPAGIGILDGDSDGLVDRLYAGDTGGNVWRVDMPGDSPNSSTVPWTVFKLAELGSGGDITQDRRFFSEPSIVRTIITDTIHTIKKVNGQIVSDDVTQQNRPYDAILIGSGDRTTPLNTDTKNKFFMLKDENIITQSFPSVGTTPIIPVPNPIKANDLSDFTSNPYQNTTGQALQDLNIAVSKTSGWFLNFAGSGEKSTASAIAIEGVAYFSSFQPAASNANSCQVDPVSGFLYAVDLALGTTVYNWTSQKIITTVGTIDTPQIVVTSDNPTGNTTPCTGANCPHVNKDNATVKVLAGKILVPVNKTLDTWRTYLNITE